MAKAPPAKRKAGRPVQNKSAPGVYSRGEVFWLRYSVGGEQVRVSLNTSDPKTANERAAELRGRPVVSKKSGKIIGGKTSLDLAVERYQSEKLKSRDFVQTSADGARQAVNNFAVAMSITDPNQATSATLAAYYTKTREAMSEATAQTYCTRVGTFLRWFGLRITTPDFESAAPTREVVVAWERSTELLALSVGEMKFILFAGFRSGMRRGEISMARPAWFDLSRKRIHIPAKDPLTGFVPKSGRARTIPLTEEFRDFILAEYTDWYSRKFCLRPEKEMGKWIYRWDFRKMLERFARNNCPELTAHVMRHSFASHLANGGIGIAQLSAWTGDRISTLEHHYLHLDADADAAEMAFAGGSVMKNTNRVQGLLVEFLEAQKTEAAERAAEAVAAAEAAEKEAAYQLQKMFIQQQADEDRMRRVILGPQEEAMRRLKR